MAKHECSELCPFNTVNEFNYEIMLIYLNRFAVKFVTNEALVHLRSYIMGMYNLFRQ